MTNSETDEAARALIATRVDEYREKRLKYYSQKNLLRELLKKDPFLPALRGITTAHDWLVEAFHAHESSSEEGAWGNTWQQILGDLTRRAVGGGDFLHEKDDGAGHTLWVLEVKTQENTVNADSAPEILRGLKSKVLHYRNDRAPGRRGVRPGIGILRGPPKDEERIHQALNPADLDIHGFQYRYLVGSSFLLWLTGIANPSALIDLSRGASLATARADCLARLHKELAEQLAVKGLDDSIPSVLSLAEEVHGTQTH